MSDRLAKYAKPRMDEARIARQWAAISKRKVRASDRWVLAAVATVALAMFVGWRVTRRAPQGAVARAGVTEIESTGSPSTLALADGSRITVGARSRLVVEDTTSTLTRVALVSGSADFEVKHDPSRTFVVMAHGVTIEDTGTRFHVECTDSARDVRVTVLEGSVRVLRSAAPASSLIAGDSWVSGVSEPHDGAAIPVAVDSVRADDDAGHLAPTAPVDDAFARFAAAAERDPTGAFDVFGVAGYPRAIERATPKQLFELGSVARLSDHPVQAADAFDALRLHHRDDPRAGLAAMQLARLREDTLHDARGAEVALRDAIALAPEPTLREDAEARRVGVLDAMNEHAGCIDAREAYLSKYPAGIHRASVEKRCGGK